MRLLKTGFKGGERLVGSQYCNNGHDADPFVVGLLGWVLSCGRLYSELACQKQAGYDGATAALDESACVWLQGQDLLAAGPGGFPT